MRKTNVLRVEGNAIYKIRYAKCVYGMRYTKCDILNAIYDIRNAKYGSCLINMLIRIAGHYLKNVKIELNLKLIILN